MTTVFSPKAPVPVQTTMHGVVSGLNSQATTFTAPIRAGNLIVVDTFTGADAGVTLNSVTSVTDNLNNTYLRVVSVLEAQGVDDTEIWIGVVTTGGVCTVTVNANLGAGTGRNLNTALHEYPGLSGRLGPTATGSGFGGTLALPPIVMRVPNSLVHCSLLSSSAITNATAGAGFTIRLNEAAAFGSGTEDGVFANAGTSVTPAFGNTSNAWAIAAVTLEPLTVGPGPGRVVQFLWGANQQNTLTFGYPLAVDEARFWRQVRKGSEQVVMNDRAESWTTARDYMGSLTIRWVPLASWSGHTGFQAFLDWCTAGNSFSLVPDAVNAPLFSLPGCLLLEPFNNPAVSPEPDGSQQITITFRNPTYDLGLAWR